MNDRVKAMARAGAERLRKAADMLEHCRTFDESLAVGVEITAAMRALQIVQQSGLK